MCRDLRRFCCNPPRTERKVPIATRLRPRFFLPGGEPAIACIELPAADTPPINMPCAEDEENPMSQLLEPCSLKHLKLRNRAAVAPMTRVSAEAEGAANELMRDYYASFAKGGFGMVISEGIYTDTAYSQLAPLSLPSSCMAARRPRATSIMPGTLRHRRCSPAGRS